MEQTNTPNNDVYDPEREKLDNEYRIWKKNCKYIYDVMISFSLEWTSLSLEWFPELTISSGKDYRTHRLLLGTNAIRGETNYILVCSVSIPDLENPQLKHNTSIDPGTYRGNKAHLGIKQRLVHDGEPNRLRYCPDNPSIIASKSTSGVVNIFDLTCHPSTPVSKEFSPDLQLHGCESEGYALCWDPKSSGRIISAGGDQLISQWDIYKASKENKSLEADRKYVGHEAAVEDVCFQRLTPGAFASVGDDRKLILWDQSSEKPSLVIERAHEGDINCVDFSWENEYRLATGGGDGYVKIWDLRKPNEAFHSFKGHNDEVLSIRFNPNNDDLVLTGARDRTSMIFDLSMKGQPQSKEDELDGPVEMVFCHAGHRESLTDVSWNWNEPMMVGSVGEDNTLQVWKMSGANEEQLKKNN